MVVKRRLAFANEILIRAACCVETRMGIVSHTHNRIDGNVAAHDAVERAHQALHVGDFLRSVEVCPHASSVHARVGASGTSNRHWLAQHHRQRAFQLLLHAYGIRLALPSMKRSAVISQSHEVAASHQSFSK